MERESSLSKALACRATQDQELITKGQLEIIQSFLSIGNENSSLREYVIEKTQLFDVMWNQMLIFLALVSFRPITSKVPPPLPIDDMWHKFILCTREYSSFCEKAAGRYLHHVPDALSSGDERIDWFDKTDKLTHFLNGKVDEYYEECWKVPEGFEIMEREKYEMYKDHYDDYQSSDDSTFRSQSSCDSCGERCAD